jgi:serine phosphatase RsbU (regulator of sigma subunit)
VLELRHFLRLPQLDPLVERLIVDRPGLVVVAGLDPRPHPGAEGESFLPSGRSGILRILVGEVLAAHPAVRAIAIVEDERSIRVPRGMGRRMRVWTLQPTEGYSELLDTARSHRPEVLVIGQLGPENVQQALAAARRGVRVLSQLDTVFCGAGVVRHLRDLGASADDMEGLLWVVTVQRFPMLCAECRQQVTPAVTCLERLLRAHPEVAGQLRSTTFYQPGGCAACQDTGRKGSVAAFDLYRVPDKPGEPSTHPSLLSLSEYVLGLAMRGHLALDDTLNLEDELLHRTYALLTAEEKAFSRVNATLHRKVVELETANRVLQHRTEALISLQGMAQTLISSTDLGELAARVCRYAGDLCGADRVVLYYGASSGKVKVLATRGWDPAMIGRVLSAGQVFTARDLQSGEPAPHAGLPPGVEASVERGLLRTGLRVPLVAQGEQVGLMTVHATRKDVFTPGEVALLRTFATQSALSIQRAGLIDQLRVKIAQLEAAQIELVQKERMERELELARQVQQSVLPRVFPQVPGYAFAARNQPAREVGGDFYDLFSLDDDHLGVVIADVSDKGMPAALYMALTRSLLLAEARRAASPCAVLSHVNRLLIELGQPNMFVTVFYGVLQMSIGQLTYVRAGHDRPILLHGGSTRLLTGEGACLGILSPDDLHLSVEETTLAPGDRLVLYTDGLTDVLSPDGTLYDLARFQALLLSHTELGAEALCDAVFGDLAAYQQGAEQYDDMTMLVVEVT